MTRSYLFIERHFWHPCSKFIGKRARFGWTRWDYVAGVTSKDDCVTTSYNGAVTHNNMDESHRHNIEHKGCTDESLFIKLKGKQNESMVRQVKIVFASVGY